MASQAFSHLVLMQIAISPLPEHFEAKEANLSSQEDVSSGLGQDFRFVTQV